MQTSKKTNVRSNKHTPISWRVDMHVADSALKAYCRLSFERVLQTQLWKRIADSALKASAANLQEFTDLFWKALGSTCSTSAKYGGGWKQADNTDTRTAYLSLRVFSRPFKKACMLCVSLILPAGQRAGSKKSGFRMNTMSQGRQACVGACTVSNVLHIHNTSVHVLTSRDIACKCTLLTHMHDPYKCDTTRHACTHKKQSLCSQRLHPDFV
jgi:hypothetical protein